MNQSARIESTGNTGDPAFPVPDFSRVPYRIYTDPAVYARELERIFSGPTWSYLALEAEVPNPGDYRTSSIGDVPIIVTRNKAGTVRAFVNRCAHRGATLCRNRHGSVKNFVCVYHQWAFNLDGELIGVPFQRGIGGNGGMPAEFDRHAYGLTEVRVQVYCGAVFGTLSAATPPVREYFGADIARLIERTLCKPLAVMGYNKQTIAANWKLYAENTKDPYHASLLHLFHATFGLYRSTQKGGVVVSADGLHSAIHARAGTDTDASLKEAFSDTRFAAVGTGKGKFSLADPSLLAGTREFDDGVTLLIMYLYPSLVLQQIGNTLAMRKVIPKGVDAFELHWTYFGYADDADELRAQRVKQSNLIGPAGLISMEDGEATQLVHDNARHLANADTVLQMGGLGPMQTEDHLVSETSIRAMWKGYCQLMDYEIR